MKTRDERIIERSIQAVEERVCPGGVVGYVAKNGACELFPFGRFTYDNSSETVVDDTIYDVASITKSIPTASLALMLIERGALNLKDPVIKYLPELKNNYREQISVWNLMTYTLDSVPLSSLKHMSADEIIANVCNRDLSAPPGSVFHYANTPALLLGIVIERVLGEGLAQAAKDYFFKPLGMKNTGYMPGQKLKSRIPPTEIDERAVPAGRQGEVRGMPHDESAYVFAQEGRAVGHAGLFSTAPDLLNFLEMLLNDGEMKGRRFFSSQTLRDMRTNQIAQLENSTGLGWELNQERFMGKNASEHTFGKTGFTGTSIVCDIERGIAFVLLSNRTYPKRTSDDGINAFRCDLADIFLVPGA